MENSEGGDSRWSQGTRLQECEMTNEKLINSLRNVITCLKFDICTDEAYARGLLETVEAKKKLIVQTEKDIATATAEDWSQEFDR